VSFEEYPLDIPAINIATHNNNRTYASSMIHRIENHLPALEDNFSLVVTTLPGDATDSAGWAEAAEELASNEDDEDTEYVAHCLMGEATPVVNVASAESNKEDRKIIRDSSVDDRKPAVFEEEACCVTGVPTPVVNVVAETAILPTR
jgi:hypothetical protein